MPKIKFVSYTFIDDSSTGGGCDCGRTTVETGPSFLGPLLFLNFIFNFILLAESLRSSYVVQAKEEIQRQIYESGDMVSFRFGRYKCDFSFGYGDAKKRKLILHTTADFLFCRDSAPISALSSQKNRFVSFTLHAHTQSFWVDWVFFRVCRRCYRTTYVEWSVFDAHRFWLGSWKRKSICAVMTAATTTERQQQQEREKKKLVNCTTAASHQLSNESQNFYISFNFILFLVHFFIFEKNRNAFP